MNIMSKLCEDRYYKCTIHTTTPKASLGSCHVRTTRVALRGCHLDAVHEGLRDARRGEGRPRLGPGVHTELSLTDRAAGVTIPPPEGEGAIELGLQK